MDEKSSSKWDRLFAFLAQPSTRKGMILVAGAVGIIVSPAHAEAIGVAVGLAYGIYQILRDEDAQLDRAACKKPPPG